MDLSLDLCYYGSVKIEYNDNRNRFLAYLDNLGPDQLGIPFQHTEDADAREGFLNRS